MDTTSYAQTAVDEEPKENTVVLNVIVEIPKGSRNKYEYDHDTGRIMLDRMLFSAVHYPSDYGFFTETLGGDGDPLDALVLVREPTFPGCLIQVRPIGLFEMVDEKGPDEKILCVPVKDPHWSSFHTLKDVAPHLLTEIAHFFGTYKELEKKKVGVKGWQDLEAALRIIKESQERYRRVSADG